MSDFLAVAREPIYSPGKVEQDRAILEAVAERLSAKHTVRVVTADEPFSDPTPGTIVFTMCQGPPALGQLHRWRNAGVRVVNTPQAIENCHRRRMQVAFERLRIPHPPSLLVSLLPFEESVDSLDVLGFPLFQTDCREMREQGFETAPEKRGLLSPNGITRDFKRLFPLALRSRRSLAASRRAVCEKIDSLQGGTSESIDSYERNGLPDWTNGPFWLKRGDVHAMRADDVVLVHGLEAASEALQGFRRRGIADALLQAHVEGDVFKFYAVQGGFFHWLPADGGTPRMDAGEERAMAALAQRGADALGLEVYGGDCIRDPSGRLSLIDLNDWPSYAACRTQAAGAIAAYLDGQTRPRTT
jgi:hypothetical protein